MLLLVAILLLPVVQVLRYYQEYHISAKNVYCCSSISSLVPVYCVPIAGSIAIFTILSLPFRRHLHRPMSKPTPTAPFQRAQA